MATCTASRKVFQKGGTTRAGAVGRPGGKGVQGAGPRGTGEGVGGRAAPDWRLKGRLSLVTKDPQTVARPAS